MSKIYTAQPAYSNILGASANGNIPGSPNVTATVTFAAVTGKRHIITGVAWSYDATPTGGSIVVADNLLGTLLSLTITASGPGFIIFPLPVASDLDAQITITLAAGGASVSGRVWALNHWTE